MWTQELPASSSKGKSGGSNSLKIITMNSSSIIPIKQNQSKTPVLQNNSLKRESIKSKEISQTVREINSADGLTLSNMGKNYSFVDQRIKEMMKDSPDRFRKTGGFTVIPEKEERRLIASSSDASLMTKAFKELSTVNENHSTKIEINVVDVQKLKNLTRNVYQQSTNESENRGNSKEKLPEPLKYVASINSKKLENEELPPLFAKSLNRLFTSNDESLIFREMFNWLEKSTNIIKAETKSNIFTRMERIQKLLMKVMNLILSGIARDSVDKTKILQMIWNLNIETTQDLLLTIPILTDRECLVRVLDETDEIVDLWKNNMKKFEQPTLEKTNLDDLLVKIKDLEDKYNQKDFLLKKNQEQTLSLEIELKLAREKLSAIAITSGDPKLRMIQTSESSNYFKGRGEVKLNKKNDSSKRILKTEELGEYSSSPNLQISKNETLVKFEQPQIKNEPLTPMSFSLKESQDKFFIRNYINPKSVIDYINRGNGQPLPVVDAGKGNSVAINVPTLKKVSTGTNTVFLDLKEAAINTDEINIMEPLDKIPYIDNKNIIIVTSQESSGKKKILVNTASDTKDLLLKRDINIQADLKREFFMVSKKIDTAELEEIFEEKKKKNAQLLPAKVEPVKKLTHTSVGVDCSGLIKKADKTTLVKIEKETESIGVQTDLRDVSHQVNDFEFSPMLPNKKGKFKEKTSPYEFRIAKIDPKSVESMVVPAREDSKPSKNQASYDFESLHVDKIELLKRIDGNKKF
jgi:hypothetical protein